MIAENAYNKIIEHIRDEIEDVKAYRSLSAECDGYTRLVVDNIVKDEESHARYLAAALKESGRSMPSDLWTEYSDLERSFRNESQR